MSLQKKEFQSQHHIHIIRGAAAVIIVVVIKLILAALFFGEPLFRPWILVLTFIVTVTASYHYERNLFVRFKEWTKRKQ